MSNNYTYLISVGGKSTQVLYYRGVPPSKSPKNIPAPKSDAEPDGTGTFMEAWADKPKAPSKDALEGGLYKGSISTGGMGGTSTIFWIIEADGRLRDVNEIVGHAVIVKAVGSVQNPVPIVVPVWAADGNALGNGKRMYYLQNNWGDK